MKVYFDSGLWHKGKGSRGRKQKAGWHFEYSGMRCVIPAVYRFPQGLVFDILSFSDETVLREYFKRYEHEQSLSSVQRRCAEQEHPFQPVNIQEIWLNGSLAQGGVSYHHAISVPWARQDEGLKPLRRAYRRYIGDAQPFACQRVRVEYPESGGFEALRRRLLPGRIKCMRLAVSAIQWFYPLDISFELPVGNSERQVEFVDPATGAAHTLYFGKTDKREISLGSGASRKLYAMLALYEIDPELQQGAVINFRNFISCHESSVAVIPSAAGYEIEEGDGPCDSAASIGIIGGADGPKAIFAGTQEQQQPKGAHGLPLHSCFSVPAFTESNARIFTIEGLSVKHIDEAVFVLGEE